MIKVTDWINKLKYIEANRSTFYSNGFPENCGLIHKGGILSFDCIGLVKSLINDPSIATKTKPVGYYVTPGKVIPDTTEIGILQLCTDVSYSFKKITPGEYLYMDGHAGVFVGEFKDPSGVVNTIECTPAFGGGVVTSYTDKSGNRFNAKGGYQVGKWAAHGKLSKYIDYTTKKEDKEDKSVFNDVEKTDKYYKYYKAVADTGVMTANKNGYFKPEKPVTRGALAIILYRLMKKAKML